MRSSPGKTATGRGSGAEDVGRSGGFGVGGGGSGLANMVSYVVSTRLVRFSFDNDVTIYFIYTTYNNREVLAI